MPDQAHAHVIAIVDFANRVGEIKFVLPVSGAAAHDTASGYKSWDDRVKLALRDQGGQLLWEESPPLSLIACDMAGGDPAQEAGGMVQHTIAIPDAASRLQLLVNDTVVDEFDTTPTAPLADTGFAMTEGLAAAGPQEPVASDNRAVSYTIQARPVGSDQWQTLAAARATPEYRIDPNQFDGASAVDVRITRNRGFRSELVSEERTAFNG